jgi:hypothetical protein
MPDKTTPHIEKAARAMCVNRVPDNIDGGPHPGGPWLDEGEPWWTGYIEQATFALRTTLEPSEAEIEAAGWAFAETYFCGDDPSKDAFPCAMCRTSSGCITAARACLIAAARVRVG